MTEQKLLLWVNLIQEFVLPMAAIFISFLFSKKFKAEKTSSVAFDTVMIAREAARSPDDPTPNTVEGITAKAIALGDGKKTHIDEELIRKIKAWAATIDDPAVGVAATPKGPAVVSTPSMLPPPPPAPIEGERTVIRTANDL